MGAATGRLGSARGSRVAESGPLSWTLKIQKIVGEPPNPGRRGHRAPDVREPALAV